MGIFGVCDGLGRVLGLCLVGGFLIVTPLSGKGVEWYRGNRLTQAAGFS